MAKPILLLFRGGTFEMDSSVQLILKTLRGRTGILKRLVVTSCPLNGTNDVLWSTNISRSVQNPIAQLLILEIFVVKEAFDDTGNFLWQSFDHPTDTLLPGMKLGWNFVTGREVYLSSWKNEEDPAPVIIHIIVILLLSTERHEEGLRCCISPLDRGMVALHWIKTQENVLSVSQLSIFK
ncbi:hypothetical protein HAX54_040879 [Datura stramonium]|uniref:Bulb-type lectin domain-containing protein n=1 Tax=Datura stramonium TaxID=4076 RepID=A0ABS8SL03_DATST|nr:hypothetical protein [Datura stramonium]